MGETIQENQATEISSVDIKNSREKIPKAVEASCIKNNTVRSLCLLKTEVSNTLEEDAYKRIDELLSAQEYLAKTANIENENEILLILRAPNGKYYLTQIPRSYGESQKLVIKVNGENINLEAVPLTNGYNTEYKINDGIGDWRQIAILFTLLNPEWKKIKEAIEKIENEIKLIEKRIPSIKSENAKLEKGLSKTKKTKKDKGILGKIDSNKKEIQRLSGRLKDITGKLPKLKEELKNHKKLINFPYTPYNRQYDKEEFHTHGFAYLNEGTKTAWEHLGSEKSLVGGQNKLEIREAFSNDIATTLNVVERMDFYVYFEDRARTKLKPQDVVESIMDTQIRKTLTTMAVNQKGAYNWQRSNVGALGIGQFMPITYTEITSRYKNVFPNSMNFENGAKNHDISFRMQAIHFHEETRALPKWIRDNWQEIVKDEQAKIGLYALIAAGYNGDIKRVVQEAELGREINVSYLIERLNEEIMRKISEIEKKAKAKKIKKPKINIIQIVKEIIAEKKLEEFSKVGVNLELILSGLNKIQTGKDLKKDLESVKEIIKGSYNDEEIKKAFFRQEIDKLHPDTLMKKLGKNKETQTYVMKFIYTWNYLKRKYIDFGA